MGIYERDYMREPLSESNSPTYREYRSSTSGSSTVTTPVTGFRDYVRRRSATCTLVGISVALTLGQYLEIGLRRSSSLRLTAIADAIQGFYAAYVYLDDTARSLAEQSSLLLSSFLADSLLGGLFSVISLFYFARIAELRIGSKMTFAAYCAATLIGVMLRAAHRPVAGPDAAILAFLAIGVQLRDLPRGWKNNLPIMGFGLLYIVVDGIFLAPVTGKLLNFGVKFGGLLTGTGVAMVCAAQRWLSQKPRRSIAGTASARTIRVYCLIAIVGVAILYGRIDFWLWVSVASTVALGALGIIVEGYRGPQVLVKTLGALAGFAAIAAILLMSNIDLSVVPDHAVGAKYGARLPILEGIVAQTTWVGVIILLIVSIMSVYLAVKWELTPVAIGSWVVFMFAAAYLVGKLVEYFGIWQHFHK